MQLVIVQQENQYVLNPISGESDVNVSTGILPFITVADGRGHFTGDNYEECVDVPLKKCIYLQ